MKSTALVPRPRFGSAASTGLFVLLLFFTFGVGMVHAQNEPILVPDAVDYQKLLPILPDPPQGWVADKAEGSTGDVGGFRITNVHRDYHKGEGDKVPTAAISILDSVANPDYVNATTAAWHNNSETSEGYGKSVTIDGNPGFEAFEKGIAGENEEEAVRGQRRHLSLKSFVEQRRAFLLNHAEIQKLTATTSIP